MQSKTDKIDVDRTILKRFADTQKKHTDIPPGAIYSGQVKHVANRAVSFLRKVGQAQERIQDVRIKNFKDDSRTVEKQRLDTSNYASKKLKEVDQMYQNLTPPGDAANAIRENIKNHKRREAEGSWGREARDVIRGMPKGERVEYVTDLIKNGEDQVAAEILGAKSAAHIGMDKGTFEQLNQRFDENFLADDLKVIKQLETLDQNVTRARKQFGAFKSELSAGLEQTAAKARAAQEAMQR